MRNKMQNENRIQAEAQALYAAAALMAVAQTPRVTAALLYCVEAVGALVGHRVTGDDNLTAQANRALQSAVVEFIACRADPDLIRAWSHVQNAIDHLADSAPHAASGDHCFAESTRRAAKREFRPGKRRQHLANGEPRSTESAKNSAESAMHSTDANGSDRPIT